MFAATLVAMSQSTFPYSFIYPIAFIVVVLAYLIWQISRPDSELPTKEEGYDEDAK